MTDIGILTKLLKVFMDVFAAGQSRIIPDALTLLQVLAVLEIALIGLWYAWARTIDLSEVVAKAITIGFFTWVVTEWPVLTRGIIRSCMILGLKAGGDVISETDFTDPSNIAWYGISVTGVIFQHFRQYTGLEALYNLAELVTSIPIALMIVLTYFVIALWIFVTLVEFYAVTAFAVALVPFGINRYTSFLAEKTFSAVLASGVQILALSFVTSATLPVLVTLQAGLNPTLAQTFALLLGSMALLALAWRASKLASAVLHGAPQLSVHDVTRTLQTAVRYVAQIYTAGTGGGAASAATLLQRRRS